MKINPQIEQILAKYSINQGRGKLFLLAVYHGLDFNNLFLPDTIAKIINTGILEITPTIQWNIPLFDNQIMNWDWVVTEYNKLWEVNRDRKASGMDVISRMKAFFSLYPQYRKEDVLWAANRYINKTNSGYLMNSAKFIFDGVGAMKKSTLLAECEQMEPIKVTIKSNDQDII